MDVISTDESSLAEKDHVPLHKTTRGDEKSPTTGMVPKSVKNVSLNRDKVLVSVDDYPNAEKGPEPVPITTGDDEGIPRETMAFKSFEEAFEFYEDYAHRRGFGVRIAHSNYFKDGRCRHIMAVLVKTDCQARIKLSKWADGLVHVKEFKDEHNHELTPLLAQSNPLKKRRKFFGDNAGESIQPENSCQEVEQACEQENLPPRGKECIENIEGV
ncbi:hypothetical protein J5N97_005969 [Dioscorea zingiberensis]|uniref:Protein FAR1-RELATED SEQUENCE n=1 Tax=Dioscorea zingiberensis TaxID=325984 RepID=A0A9D5D9C7_9LILI|nr:hypothetical protein J5N97_005969 [Dioscorea zingiberensis]